MASKTEGDMKLYLPGTGDPIRITEINSNFGKIDSYYTQAKRDLESLDDKTTTISNSEIDGLFS